MWSLRLFRYALLGLFMFIATTIASASPQDFNTLLAKGNQYYNTGQYKKAIEVCDSMLQFLRSGIGTETVIYSDVLTSMANCYTGLQDYNEAIELHSEAMTIRKKVLGDSNPKYIASLKSIAANYLMINDYGKAIESLSIVADFYLNYLGENHLDYAMSLNFLSHCYYMLGEYTKAIELGTKAQIIYESKHGENNSENYASLLSDLAGCYSEIGKYGKAIELETHTLKIRNDVLGENHLDYVRSLYNLAFYYSKVSNSLNAINLLSQALVILENNQGKNDSIYVSSIELLATIYSEQGDFSKALELHLQALEIYRQTVGENHPVFAKALSNMGRTYYYLGIYPKAIELQMQALEIYKQTNGDNNSDYALLLNNLAGIYTDLGEYSKAIELQTQAQEIYKQTIGKNHPEYARSLSSLGFTYCSLGDYYKALELGFNSMKIYEDALGENNPDYASALYLITSSYFGLGDYDKAIELGKKAATIYKQTYGENHSNYAAALGLLALCYNHLGNFDNAIDFGIQTTDIFRQVKGEHHPDYALSLQQLAIYYTGLGDFRNADFFATKALKIQKDFIGENDISYAMSLYILALIKYMSNENIKEGVDYYRMSINCFHNYVFKLLAQLPGKGRNSFWNKNSIVFQLYPMFVSMAPTDFFLGDLYDRSCIFAKGLLLSTETEMRRLLLDSGDNETVSKFEQLQATRTRLNKLYEQPIAERSVSTDSLEIVAERLEMELVNQSQVYGDFMHNLKLTWRDVQAKLGDKDVAVEFMSFPVMGDTTQYIALTVKKGYDAPHLVRLFSDQHLQAIKSSYYKKPELSRLVWGKMADELDGVEKIYFSPSGELYNIAIESMPHWADSCMMSDRFNLYRLSSTRELAINRSETKSSGAVIYGGIQFDTDVANMGAPQQGNGVNSYIAYRSFKPDYETSRSNWAYLPGTLVEANQVNAILKDAKKTQVKLISGEHATETSFKQLSGQKNRILHIATHGFYYTESTAERKNKMDKLRFLLMDDKQQGFVEDKAMTRSGLLFAGAQNTFNGVEIPAGIDDGVLTAQEISQLDLRGLDLLVLSACKTGLGEIKGDGVFGLQRGFKIAGAQTIMMSLRAVDDDATKDMMIQFYKALVSGKTKREAFIQAQQYIKDHDSEYIYKSSDLREQFPHWAAFILLDAM